MIRWMGQKKWIREFKKRLKALYPELYGNVIITHYPKENKVKVYDKRTYRFLGEHRFMIDSGTDYGGITAFIDYAAIISKIKNIKEDK